MDYRERDRGVWQQILADAPDAWLQAEPSALMLRCAGFLRRHGAPRVLDLGSGFGRWTCFVAAETHCHAVGLDYAIPGLHLGARLATPAGGTAFAAGEITALPFADGSFDGFLAVLVLDNVARPEGRAAVAELSRVVRPGAPGFVVLNPWPMPEDAGQAENPTRSCTRHDYSDDEAMEVLFSAWVVASWERVEHGLRVAEVHIGTGGAG